MPERVHLGTLSGTAASDTSFPCVSPLLTGVPTSAAIILHGNVEPTNAGRSFPVLKTLEPRWGYRAECTLPAMPEWLDGWLVVEIHDYDRIGDGAYSAAAAAAAVAVAWLSSKSNDCLIGRMPACLLACPHITGRVGSDQVC
eukprot:SAG22_NODE_301_length_12744_cov_19.648189_9_plen_142_part_00